MTTEKLRQLGACYKAQTWAKEQNSYKEAWEKCERGDWMLWLAARLGIDDKKLTLAKALCAKQVEHMITSPKSLACLKGCFDYVEDRIKSDELKMLFLDAYKFSNDFPNTSKEAANRAAVDAANYSCHYSIAAYVAYAIDYSTANIFFLYDYQISIFHTLPSLKESANICRKVLTDEVLKKYIE
jgi:hypothetical protein